MWVGSNVTTRKGSRLQSHCVCVVEKWQVPRVFWGKAARVLANRAYPAPSLHLHGSDESELEEGRDGQRTALLSPICKLTYEPVASNESDDADSDSDEPEVEERRHNTDWYVF